MDKQDKDIDSDSTVGAIIFVYAQKKNGTHFLNKVKSKFQLKMESLHELRKEMW